MQPFTSEEDDFIIEKPLINNKIYYTATQKVEPYKTDVFGANIVSNEWDSTTGEGVIIFDGEVTSIGNNAFTGCYDSLTGITIPDSVTSIGESAFEACMLLTDITIPDSVTSIGNAAFCDCESLASATIGNGVTSIGQIAFFNCVSLTSVFCKPIVPPLGWYSMFSYNGRNRKIYVPHNSVDAYKSASGWSDYADYIEGYDF